VGLNDDIPDGVREAGEARRYGNRCGSLGGTHNPSYRDVQRVTITPVGEGRKLQTGKKLHLFAIPGSTFAAGHDQQTL
jgi:hypothetical protein